MTLASVDFDWTSLRLEPIWAILAGPLAIDLGYREFVWE